MCKLQCSNFHLSLSLILPYIYHVSLLHTMHVPHGATGAAYTHVPGTCRSHLQRVASSTRVIQCCQLELAPSRAQFGCHLCLRAEVNRLSRVRIARGEKPSRAMTSQLRSIVRDSRKKQSLIPHGFAGPYNDLARVIVTSWRSIACRLERLVSVLRRKIKMLGTPDDDAV